MVCFHSFFYVGNFVSDTDMHAAGLSPWLLVLNLGFLPVDGFFALTGFLIAHPLFREEQRRIKAAKEGDSPAAATANGALAANNAPAAPRSLWQFDLGAFYYRRVTRMVPSYVLAIWFHCGLLFPGLVQHSMDLVRSNNFRNFIDRVLPGIKDAPNNCTPEKLWTNLTWTSHLMPFGGSDTHTHTHTYTHTYDEYCPHTRWRTFPPTMCSAGIETCLCFISYVAFLLSLLSIDCVCVQLHGLDVEFQHAIQLLSLLPAAVEMGAFALGQARNG